MRCSDSARFVSGKSPMSSAVMASTTPAALRLRSIEASRLARMPVTTTSSSATGAASCASAGIMAVAPSASAMPSTRGFLRIVVFCIGLNPPGSCLFHASTRAHWAASRHARRFKPCAVFHRRPSKQEAKEG